MSVRLALIVVFVALLGCTHALEMKQFMGVEKNMCMRLHKSTSKMLGDHHRKNLNAFTGQMNRIDAAFVELTSQVDSKAHAKAMGLIGDMKKGVRKLISGFKVLDTVRKAGQAFFKEMKCLWDAAVGTFAFLKKVWTSGCRLRSQGAIGAVFAEFIGGLGDYGINIIPEKFVCRILKTIQEFPLWKCAPFSTVNWVARKLGISRFASEAVWRIAGLLRLSRGNIKRKRRFISGLLREKSRLAKKFGGSFRYKGGVVSKVTPTKSSRPRRRRRNIGFRSATGKSFSRSSGKKISFGGKKAGSRTKNIRRSDNQASKGPKQTTRHPRRVRKVLQKLVGDLKPFAAAVKNAKKLLSKLSKRRRSRGRTLAKRKPRKTVRSSRRSRKPRKVNRKKKAAKKRTRKAAKKRRRVKRRIRKVYKKFKGLFGRLNKKARRRLRLFSKKIAGRRRVKKKFLRRFTRRFAKGKKNLSKKLRKFVRKIRKRVRKRRVRRRRLGFRSVRQFKRRVLRRRKLRGRARRIRRKTIRRIVKRRTRRVRRKVTRRAVRNAFKKFKLRLKKNKVPRKMRKKLQRIGRKIALAFRRHKKIHIRKFVKRNVKGKLLRSRIAKFFRKTRKHIRKVVKRRVRKVKRAIKRRKITRRRRFKIRGFFKRARRSIKRFTRRKRGRSSLAARLAALRRLRQANLRKLRNRSRRRRNAFRRGVRSLNKRLGRRFKRKKRRIIRRRKLVRKVRRGIRRYTARTWSKLLRRKCSALKRQLNYMKRRCKSGRCRLNYRRRSFLFSHMGCTKKLGMVLLEMGEELSTSVGFSHGLSHEQTEMDRITAEMNSKQFWSTEVKEQVLARSGAFAIPEETRNTLMVRFCGTSEIASTGVAIADLLIDSIEAIPESDDDQENGPKDSGWAAFFARGTQGLGSLAKMVFGILEDSCGGADIGYVKDYNAQARTFGAIGALTTATASKLKKSDVEASWAKMDTKIATMRTQLSELTLLKVKACAPTGGSSSR